MIFEKVKKVHIGDVFLTASESVKCDGEELCSATVAYNRVIDIYSKYCITVLKYWLSPDGKPAFAQKYITEKELLDGVYVGQAYYNLTDIMEVYGEYDKD